MGKRTEIWRKRTALIDAWNSLVRETGKGVLVKQDDGYMRSAAGRLIEYTRDRQGVFREGAREYLGQFWRAHSRTLMGLARAWDSLEVAKREASALPALPKPLDPLERDREARMALLRADWSPPSWVGTGYQWAKNNPPDWKVHPAQGVE